MSRLNWKQAQSLVSDNPCKSLPTIILEVQERTARECAGIAAKRDADACNADVRLTSAYISAEIEAAYLTEEEQRPTVHEIVEDARMGVAGDVPPSGLDIPMPKCKPAREEEEPEKLWRHSLKWDGVRNRCSHCGCAVPLSVASVSNEGECPGPEHLRRKEEFSGTRKPESVWLSVFREAMRAGLELGCAMRFADEADRHESK